MHGSEVKGLRCTDISPQRPSKRDSRARESDDLTPVHSNGTLRLIQGTKMCTGIKQKTPVHDTVAQRLYNAHTRVRESLSRTMVTIPHDSPAMGLKQGTSGQTHVHRGHLTGLRYTDMRHQRLSKKDSCARGVSDLTPVHSNGILRPIQGTKMCTEVKQNDSRARHRSPEAIQCKYTCTGVVEPDHGHDPSRFPSHGAQTRHKWTDTRAQETFDGTPVHRHATSKTVKEEFMCTGPTEPDSGARTYDLEGSQTGFVCTGVKQNDPGVRRCCSEGGLGYMKVHGGRAKRPPCTDS